MGDDEGTRDLVVPAGDGTPLAVQVHDGGAAAPPLVLLAGQANSHAWWDPVRADLGRGRTTVTLDWRGTGASGPPASVTSTATFAADVVAVLDGLGLGRSDVYGTSMGGRVAQELALAAPARVRRLVLGCTSPGGPHAHERDDAVRRGLARPAPEARALLLDLMYTPAWRAAHPDGPYPVLGDPTMTTAARRAHLRASDGHDAWDRLPGVVAPTLVLHGTDDRMTPAGNAALLAHRIPDARVHLLAGARHAYFQERAAESGALVRAFLDR